MHWSYYSTLHHENTHKGEHTGRLKSPHFGHFCANNCRGWCDSLRIKILKQGFVHACFDLEIFSDPVLYKRMSLIKHFHQVELMLLKLVQIDYFDFA